MAQKTGDEMLLFHYDENGSPLGFRYRNGTYDADVWDEYIYEKNLQGDIVAIYNNVGTMLVSYTYDAFGNVNKGYYNGGSDTGASKNPLTYRGYYHDQDLGLYYLQSRYYDSVVGRFINADEIGFLGANGDLNSYNLYAYCSNNPVMYTDPSGNVIIEALIWGAIIGFAISFTTSVVSQYWENDGNVEEINWKQALYEGAVGGVGGALAASPLGFTASFVAGATLNCLSSIGNDLLFNNGEIDGEKAIFSALIGAGAAFIAGSGANCIKDGKQVSKYLKGAEVLRNTIANNSKQVISRQTNALLAHQKQLVISGVRYFLANGFSLLASHAAP